MEKLVRSMPLEDQWWFVATMTFAMMFLAVLCLWVSVNHREYRHSLRVMAHGLTVATIGMNLLFSKAVTDQCEYVVQVKDSAEVATKDRQPESIVLTRLK